MRRRGHSTWSALRARLAAEESGFTVFETLIAGILLIIGALATFQAFDAATRNTYRAEQSQVANDIGQREMEKIRALDYSQIAMTGYPSYSSDPNNPNNRVAGTDYALNRDGSNQATMVVNGSALYGGGVVSGGTIALGPTVFTNGDVSGTIHRYVVWRDDPSCLTICPGAQDYKRVVIAVSLSDTGLTSDRAYVEIQSDFIDPNDTAQSETIIPPGGVVTARQYYLSDTVCSNGGSTTRIVPTADHLTHNTLGTCSNGLQTGSTSGAPDALLTDPPPDAFPLDPNLPDSFDYANDSYLEPAPDFDDGLQMLRQDANGCNYTPTGTQASGKIHRWVTDTISPGFNLTGHATLELHSKTINGAIHTGKVCIYLFIRNGSTDTRLTDSATGLAYWTYQPPGNWAAGSWTTYRIGMIFPPTALASNRRLGLAISVERAGSPGHLQFMYEHPNFDARLEIGTVP